LKEIERKAWKSCYQDGMWDIFLGLVLLSFGIIPLLEEFGVPDILGYIIVFAPTYILFYAGKKYITVPRGGIVKFGPTRKMKNFKLVLILLISVIFGLVVMLLTTTDLFPYKTEISIWPIIFAINALIVLSLMAYFLDFPRLYIYSIFFATSIFLVEISRSHVGSMYNTILGFGLPGVVMVLVGLLHLIRFIRRYPLPKKEV
jgi:hypothetical protein